MSFEKTKKRPPTKVSIVDYWIQNAEDLGLEEIDFANPNCFACGQLPSQALGYAANKTNTPKGLKWSEKTRLQKAHVVPRSLGGNNEPSNFLLLCDICHKECPDIKDRELVLRWVKNRPNYFIRFNRDIDEAFVQLGYPNWRDIEFFNDPTRFRNSLTKGEVGWTKEWTTHGAKMSVATIAAVMVKQYEQFSDLPGNREASLDLH